MIIGNEFIEVFAEEARKLDGIEFLAQGTIWPDILESEEGIKVHHNAGGLPEDMNFELVELFGFCSRTRFRELTACCVILHRSRQERWNSNRPGRSPSRESSPQGTITWKFMDFGTADKKCQLSSKVLFHFHELCQLRLRKTREGDLPGPGGRRKL